MAGLHDGADLHISSPLCFRGIVAPSGAFDGDGKKKTAWCFFDALRHKQA